MPPDAVIVCEYAVPTVAVASVVGENVITGQICSVIARDPWQPFASFTRTVTEVAGLAEAVGVPLMTPVLALSVNPAGSVPAVTVHELYGETPPVAVRVCE